jgi:hypothetical protein
MGSKLQHRPVRFLVGADSLLVGLPHVPRRSGV